ncbi:hypothetical protein BB561_000766 [Smittium simulii]|uniref:S1 motif domain-containing protein n=1 Tax=Smittium simulii TaxID=133385 RepID=A0A2T9YXM6_9FUNG|nr:hypothetical protein BB561_000766 [Smittium simulii]
MDISDEDKEFGRESEVGEETYNDYQDSEEENDEDDEEFKQKKMEESLDEDDLDLVEENTGYRPAQQKSVRRLKRRRDHVRASGSESEESAFPSDKKQSRLHESPSHSSDEESRIRNKSSHLNDRDDFHSKRIDRITDDLGLFDDEVNDNRDSQYQNPSGSRYKDKDSRSQSRFPPKKNYMDDFIEDESENEEQLEEINNRDPRSSSERRNRTQADWGAAGDSFEGMDEDEMDDLFAIFGDGTEYSFALEAPSTEKDDAHQEVLDAVFEPSEIAEKLLTSRDEEIRAADLPERFQERGTEDDMRRALTDEEIDEETSFILKFFTKISENTEYTGPSRDLLNQDRFVAAILSVLKLLSQEFMEVPFIFTHRKDIFITPSLGTDSAEIKVWLTESDIWLLFDLDTQFRTFLTKRSQLMSQVAEVVEAGEWSFKDKEFLMQMLDSSSEIEDISDLLDWVHYKFDKILTVSRIETSLYKQSKKAETFDSFKNQTLIEFINLRVGISASEFGFNLMGLGRYFVDDHDRLESPEQSITSFLSKDTSLVDVSTALNMAQISFAQMIATDPTVRKFLRMRLSRELYIRVRPTTKGFAEINGCDHPYFSFKFLKPKHIKEFTNSGQFLQILKAEKEGLVKLGFTLDSNRFFGQNSSLLRKSVDDDVSAWEEEQDDLIKQLVKTMDIHLCSDSVHESAEKWNVFRRNSLKISLKKFLFPLMHKYLVDRLRIDSENYLARIVAGELHKRVNIQPLRTSRMSANDTPRVVVVAGGGFSNDIKGAIRIVNIDDHGRYTEHKVVDTLREETMGHTRLLRNGTDELRLLLEKKQPDVVAIAGMVSSTLKLIEDVRRITDDHKMATSDEIYVTPAPDELARIYYNSERAKSEFPYLTDAERYAMCVGRCLQDPLNEYTAMGKELLGLSLHPLQRLIPSEVRWKHLQRVLITNINNVGVNINEIIQHPHKSATLSYVSGLGARKAQYILNTLSGPAGNSIIDSRSDLIYRELVTRNIFVNCASFLKIWPAPADLLDSTRIHPENYELARKMAADALDVEDDEDDYNDSGDQGRSSYRSKKKYKDGPSKYVAEVMRRSPEKLDELILSEYALELEKRLGVSKLCCLQSIKDELQHPFQDYRKKFDNIDPVKIFEMYSNESIGDTLRDDGTAMVIARVCKVKEKFAIARLDSGIDAFINIANIDDARIESVEDVLYVGQTVTGVVKKIDFEKLSVDISIKPSDLENAKNLIESPPQNFYDAYYDFEADQLAKTKSKIDLQRTQSLQRSIAHPLFRPFNSRQAERYLLSRPVGDCVIRPSSLGMDHIVITWKIAPGLYQHIDVLELNKPNEMALGKTLKIRDSQFGDLDELLAMYIEPLSRRFDEVKRCPKFYNPDRDPAYASLNNKSSYANANNIDEELAEPEPTNTSESLQQQLDRQKRHKNRCNARIERYLSNLSQSTGRGSYCLSLNYETPGTLYFYFKPNPKAENFIKWVVRVKPDEFLLGEKGRYPNVSSLINGFKTIAANTLHTQQNSYQRNPPQHRGKHDNQSFNSNQNNNFNNRPRNNAHPTSNRSPNQFYHNKNIA